MVDAEDSKSSLGNKVLVRVRSSVMFNKFFKSKKLVCFDFDGLLVDTEPLHHLTYETVLDELGFPLELDFISYCKVAHSSNRDLFNQTVKQKYPDFPHEWIDIRNKKIQLYKDLLKQGLIKAMPGAAKLIEKLKEENIPFCIVTNSNRCDVDEITNHLPFLKKVPKIFAREDYKNPKPEPDGYLTALKFHGVESHDAIGLEDTHKGITALQKAGMPHLLINSNFMRQSEIHFASLDDFNA